MRNIAVMAALLVVLSSLAWAEDDTVFNKASSWIADWGKCGPSESHMATTERSTSKKMDMSGMAQSNTDVLGNKVPSGTSK